MYRNLFSFQANDLIFKARSGNSATKSKDIITINPTKKYELKIIKWNDSPFFHISKSTSKTSGKNIKNKVFKGVGTPIKESVCLVSKLNFANLNIDIKGMNKAKNGKYLTEASIWFGTP